MTSSSTEWWWWSTSPKRCHRRCQGRPRAPSSTGVARAAALEPGQVAAERVVHDVHAGLVVRAVGDAGLAGQVELDGAGGGRGHGALLGVAATAALLGPPSLGRPACGGLAAGLGRALPVRRRAALACAGAAAPARDDPRLLSRRGRPRRACRRGGHDRAPRGRSGRASRGPSSRRWACTAAGRYRSTSSPTWCGTGRRRPPPAPPCRPTCPGCGPRWGAVGGGRRAGPADHRPRLPARAGRRGRRRRPLRPRGGGLRPPPRAARRHGGDRAAPRRVLVARGGRAAGRPARRGGVMVGRDPVRGPAGAPRRAGRPRPARAPACGGPRVPGRRDAGAGRPRRRPVVDLARGPRAAPVGACRAAARPRALPVGAPGRGAGRAAPAPRPRWPTSSGSTPDRPCRSSRARCCARTPGSRGRRSARVRRAAGQPGGRR